MDRFEYTSRFYLRTLSLTFKIFTSSVSIPGIYTKFNYRKLDFLIDDRVIYLMQNTSLKLTNILTRKQKREFYKWIDL